VAIRTSAVKVGPFIERPVSVSTSNGKLLASYFMTIN